jgi:transposase
MRGEDRQQVGMFSYVSLEKRVPADHPLRTLWVLTDSVLRDLSRRFARLYSDTGRPSIAPEKLLRAQLLQILYSIRSERLLMEQLNYNLLFRWFVGLELDEPVWDATVFTKNRQRLLAGDIAQAFLEKVLALAREHALLSDEHFTVDGTLVEAWAGQKSFQRKDRQGPPPRDGEGGGVDFHGERRSNATHESTTDPDCRLYRKTHHGTAHLSYMGHMLMDNRHGLAVAAEVTRASGTAERESARRMLQGQRRGRSVGADKGYDTRDFVAQVRQLGMVAHVAQNTTRQRSAIDARTTRHHGYHLSQWCRHRVERIFGWMKTVGLMRKTRYRGVAKVDWIFTFTAAVYNVMRMRNLVTAASG